MSVHNSLPFAIIPEWLIDSGVSDKAIRLYAVLARYADKETMHAYPSRRTLADRLNASVKSVDRALTELVKAGAVHVDKRFGIEGQQNSNDYILTPGRDTDVAPRKATDVAPRGVVGDARTRAIEREPLEREEVLASRKRDAIWDLLVEVYGEPTSSGRGARNAATKVLRDYGAAPAEIRTFISVMAQTDRDWAVTTPSALAKHFGERDALMAQVTTHRRKRVGQSAELMRQALEG